MRTALILVSLIIVLSACNNGKTGSDNTEKPKTDTVVNTKEESLNKLSNEVLTCLKNEDYEKLSGYIHPNLGVRFSPYSFIDVDIDVRLSEEAFIGKINKQEKLNWGRYDGSGDEIILTIQEYFGEFVYTADFLNAEKKSLNQVLGGGTTVNNIEEVYSDCDFMEFYFSGFEPEYEGLDWCSLRLVFQKYEGKYYLVGIIHDQWTI